MKSKPIQKTELNKDFFDNLSSSDICKVSKASTEIMLDRFSYGKEIDFPFSK